MLSKTGRFRRADRILRSREFQRVVKSGKRRTSSGFVVLLAPRAKTKALGPNCAGDRRRLGITVSKRVGNAVVRNRLKRCIREWFRASRGNLPAAAEVVVIARRAAGGLSRSEVRAQLGELLISAEDHALRGQAAPAR